MKEAAELRDPTQHYHAQPLEVRHVLFDYFNSIINYTDIF